MKDTDIAWAAGFIDGEGHVGLRMVPATGTTSPRLSATQSIRDPLDELQRLFGGSVSGPIRSKRGYSDQYTWNSPLGAADILRIIETLLPHFRVKRKQAVLLLSYLNTVAGESGVKFKHGLSEDALRQRIAFFLEMKELNRHHATLKDESDD